MVLLSIIGVASAIFVLSYFAYNSVSSQAKGKGGGRAYYWCAEYRNGQVVNRYCYGDTGMCQTYNLYNNKPKDNPKKNQTFSCYSDKVYVRRKGAPCPPDDYVVENANGASVGCFGGFKEKNLKIIKK